MAFDAHANFGYSAVAVAPSPASSGTSLTVTTGTGPLFPAPPFNCTVWATGVQAVSTNAEIVRVTNVSGDVFTIVRQQESTAARSILVGDQIGNTVTVKDLTDVESAVTTAGGNATTALANAATAQSTANAALGNPKIVGITVDGAGSVITAGVKGYVLVPINCTITKAVIAETSSTPVSGSIAVDIWASSSYPPTVSNLISSTHPVSLSSQTNSSDSTLTGWTTSITAGTWVAFSVRATPVSVVRVVLELQVTPS